jgi:hypothetical protein
LQGCDPQRGGAHIRRPHIWKKIYAPIEAWCSAEVLSGTAPAREEAGGGKRLVAYVVAAPEHVVSASSTVLSVREGKRGTARAAA